MIEPMREPEFLQENKCHTKEKAGVHDYDPNGILHSGELHPKLTRKIEQLLITAQSEGLNVFLFEGLRTNERQQELYDSGSGVTNAKAGQSFHNYGLAADLVFRDDEGNASWSMEHDWQRLGQLGENLGLKWGGSFHDYGHFRLNTEMSIHEIQMLFETKGRDEVWGMLNVDD